MIENPAIPNNRRIAKNTIFLYLRMFFALIVTLYTTRVVLQVLGVVDFGIYNVVCGFVTMFGFLNASLSQGIQRFYSFEIGKNEIGSIPHIYTVALYLQLGVAVCLLFFVEVFGYFWFEYKLVIPIERLPVAKWIFQFSVLSLILGVFQVPYSAMVMAFERMNYYAIVSVFDVCIKLVIVILLPYMNVDYLLFYGLLLIITSVLNFFLYYIYCKVQFPFACVYMKPNKHLVKPMFSFSGWNTLGAFSYMMKSQGIDVILNSFFGTIVNAANGIANQIMGAIQLFSINIISAFRPQLISSYSQGNFLRVKKMMFIMSKVTFLFIYMISIPIILDIGYVLQVWLGDSVPEYVKSFSVLGIISMILSNFNIPVTQVIHATGKMKNYQIASSVIIFLIIPLSWFTLKVGYSPISVYWITILMIIINQICSLLILKSEFVFSLSEYCYNVFLPCLFVAILSVVFPYLIHISFNSSILRFLGVCTVSCLTTLIFGFFLLTNEEEKLIIIKWGRKNIFFKH